MICVLEGVDSSGKTTLAKKIKTTWEESRPGNEGIIVHTGPPGDWNSEEMSLADWRKYCTLRIKAVVDMVEPHDGRRLLILDRLHLGSPIYGRLFRPQVDHDGFGDLGRRNFYMLDNYIADRGGITLHINPPLETILTRSVGREDEYLDNVEGANKREQQLTNIYNEYVSFIEREKQNLASYAGSGVFTSSKAISKLPGYQDFISNTDTDKTGDSNG